MKTLDLFIYNGQIHRILSLLEEKALVINCGKQNMPIWIELSLLNGCCESSEEELISTANIVDYDSLSSQKKKLAHNRYTLIAPILPIVADKYMRSRLIAKIADTQGVSKQTVRRYLCIYLSYQNISALVSCEKDSDKLSDDEKNFRWALNKYYYSSLKHTVKGTYLLMLKEKYTDSNGILTESFPRFHKFRYFYNKTKKLQNYYISRNGFSNYLRNNRPLLSEGVREFATSIGIGMLDSTILDIYLVNEEGQVIGRPILTACVDAYSGLCCGYSLSWEGGVYSLKCLFDNIISDKVELCKQFGIDINKEDWNCDRLPATFVTDKGKEYTSYLLEQITDLGVSIINLPPYRPDLKSYVEQFFNVIQNLYKPYLKGKGVIEDDFRERGAMDYRKTACLTLREMETVILKCILYYNTQRVVKSYPYSEHMIDSNILPYANCIWNYAFDKTGSDLIKVSKELLYLTLLPRNKARFTKHGLVYNKLRYGAEGFTEQYLRGSDCVIAYDSNNTSCIWLYDNGNYTEFTLIDKQYNDKSFETARLQMNKKNDYLMSFENVSTQSKINLINDIQTIADNCSLRTNIDLSSIRNTRIKEKKKKRMGM